MKAKFNEFDHKVAEYLVANTKKGFSSTGGLIAESLSAGLPQVKQSLKKIELYGMAIGYWPEDLAKTDYVVEPDAHKVQRTYVALGGIKELTEAFDSGQEGV